MTVEPSTTWEFSDNPLNAATVRVVRLLAAAIDHSVSPGCTVCGTAAPAGAASKRAKRSTNRGKRRKAKASGVETDLTRLALKRPDWKRCARRYVALQRSSRAQGGLQALSAEVALVRAQRTPVEPGPDPLRVRPAPRVRPLAAPRRRSDDVRRAPPDPRRARSAGAERVAHRLREHPHRRGDVPEPRRAGRQRRGGPHRRPLHVRQR